MNRRHTTSYNPKCNGFLEGWHRTLKSALMCYNRDDWSRILPSVLLGLRTIFREEFKTSPAELVYGTTIRIPGQFLENSKQTTCQSEYVALLKQHFNEIQPSPATNHATQRIFVFKELKDCSHVFLRTDAIRRTLQPPYEGPFPVISREDKTFFIEIKGKHLKVSIDRLKPCYNETDEELLPTSTVNTSSNDKISNASNKK